MPFALFRDILLSYIGENTSPFRRDTLKLEVVHIININQAPLIFSPLSMLGFEQ
jgi:hypothetical protein